MKSLSLYLNEGLMPLNESFIDYDTALENVPEKMKDVAKLKILVKKFDKFGEENEYDENEDPYDMLMSLIKGIVKPKKFDELNKEYRSSYSEDYATKVKNRTKYCDKLFSAVHANYKKDQWASPTTLTTALVGIAYWIENYAGFQDKEIDKYLGKLCAKYEKVFGLDPNDATKITQMYNQQKVSIQDAINIENKTKASIQEIKDDFKKHKFTVFSYSHESAVRAIVIDNKDYDSLDEAYKSFEAERKGGSPLENYDLDKILRRGVEEGKIDSLYLCDGYYCIGEDHDKKIPYFGYYDEDIIGKEIYSYSGYNSKFYFRGQIPTDKKRNAYYDYYDSLWTTWKKS